MYRAFWFILPINLVLIASGIARKPLGLPVEWLMLEGSIVVGLNTACLVAFWCSRKRAANGNQPNRMAG